MATAEPSPSIPISIGTEPPLAAIEVGTPGDGDGELEVADDDVPPALDPTPVDFDALHAALGEGSREAAPPQAMPVAAATKAARAPVTESQGRSSATYASSRALAPPVAHVDADLGAPAVIVATDTVPAAAPQMTTPMAPPMMSPHHHHHHGSSPHIGTPSSGGMRAVPAHAPGNTPQAFDPVALGLPPARPGQPALTMRMPERPRRPRTPTVVVRHRGPSTKQKVAVFTAMLFLVSLIGLAIVIWRAPQLFGFGSKTAPTTAHAAPAMTTAVPTVSVAPPASTVAPASSASASATAAASAKPALKPPKRL